MTRRRRGLCRLLIPRDRDIGMELALVDWPRCDCQLTPLALQTSSSRGPLRYLVAAAQPFAGQTRSKSKNSAPASLTTASSFSLTIAAPSPSAIARPLNSISPRATCSQADRP